MKLSAFVRGLEILRPHFKDADGFHIGAEHDQFYVYMTDTPLEENEITEMKELGWFSAGGRGRRSVRSGRGMERVHMSRDQAGAPIEGEAT